MEPRSILFIDDDPDIRRIAELSLGLVGGWTVFLAADGEAGLAAAREHRPDAILLDVMMPGLDGPLPKERRQAAEGGKRWATDAAHTPRLPGLPTRRTAPGRG